MSKKRMDCDHVSYDDALLPAMDQDLFQNSYVYKFLEEHQDYQQECFLFLGADDLDDLVFVANPRYGYYTPYDQDDFDKVLSFLELKQSMITGSTFHRFFQPVDTVIGKYIICKHIGGGVLGFLSKR